MKGPLFFAKILLFGEYGIIKDSMGLSIPYNFYHGSLKIPYKNNTPIKESHQKLLAFSNYLKTLDADLISFNWKKFNFDLKWSDSNSFLILNCFHFLFSKSFDIMFRILTRPVKFV